MMKKIKRYHWCLLKKSEVCHTSAKCSLQGFEATKRKYLPTGREEDGTHQTNQHICFCLKKKTLLMMPITPS